MPVRRHAYFAYGSNLCSRQMARRCPDAIDPRPAVLGEHDWLINQRGVATVEQFTGTQVHGVLWQLSDRDLAALDNSEGVPVRYRRDLLTVSTADGPSAAWVYIDHRVKPGPPRPGYLERIIGGANAHGLPKRWIEFLARWDPAGWPRPASSPTSIAPRPDHYPHDHVDVAVALHGYGRLGRRPRRYPAGARHQSARLGAGRGRYISGNVRTDPRAGNRGPVLEVVVVFPVFRFGVGIRAVKSRAALQEKARRLEDAGFDILYVPDHLGAPAPFPALTAIAQATTTARVGTYVLNACFYKPALLARDVAGLDLLSDGRFDAGLGAGYVREEFEAAELPFPSPGRRVEYLEHVSTYLKKHQPSVPILIAGGGDRLMSVAARHADIVGLTGASPHGTDDPLAERIEFVHNAAGERFASLELNLAITAVSPADGGTPDLSMTRRYAPELSEPELLALPGVLGGSTQAVADKLRAHRDNYGVTSFTVQENNVDSFAKVIAELR